MMLSLDGYIEAPGHDLSWHNVDAEFNDFAVQQLNDFDSLMFGRRTYEMMAEFWPSDIAKKTDPIVAGIMNNMPKVVLSHSLDSADWENANLIKGDLSGEVKRLKEASSRGILVLGSSNLAVSLIENNLLDELRVIINPVLIGNGTRLFDGLKSQPKLKLLGERTFNSGNVLIRYKVG